MAKIITENFKTETTNSLFDSLGTDDFYVIASQSLTGIEFEGETAISNTQMEKRDFQRKAIFGNRITKANARYMFLENPYQAGRVYDAYDDAKDVETLNMIVTVQEDGSNNFLVLKCIDNNNGAISREVPGAVDDTVYSKVTTQDGYVWQYMFTVLKDEIEQYKTGSHFPCPTFPDFGGGYGDPNVFEQAEEDISRIVVESTYEGQFSQYLFGEATSTGNASDVQTVSSVDSDTPGIKRVVVSTVAKTGRTLYSVDGAYKNMYLRHNTSGRLYDVVNSVTSIGSNQLTLFIRTDNLGLDSDESIDSFTPDGQGPKQCQLVVKVNVTPSTLTGKTAKAYAVVDETGTLQRVAFERRGTEYKHASAEIVYPPLLKGSQSVSENPTVLRAVISPKGGHGSDPIRELAMSRLALVTNFDGENPFVPNMNNYSVVGLVKNPVLKDEYGNSTIPADPTQEHTFDNRLRFTLSGPLLQNPENLTGTNARITTGGKVNHYIEQYIKTIDIREAQNGVSYTIVDPGNMRTLDDWVLFQDNAQGPAIGTVFTARNMSQIDGTRNARVAFATTSVDTSVNTYDYSLDVLTARIYEMEYREFDLINESYIDKTYLYLVDYYGDFEHKFQKGIFYIKEAESSTVSINTLNVEDIDYGEYEPYSGDLLHFIDFSPITREADKSEKIKFTFDF